MLFVYLAMVYEIGPAVFGGKGLHVMATSKMVTDSSGCYLRVNRHFDVRAEEFLDAGYIEYKLYRDDVYTESHTYDFIERSMYRMVDQLFFNYHHPKVEKKLKEKPIYKFYSKKRCE